MPVSGFQVKKNVTPPLVGDQYHVLHGLLPPIKSTGHDLRTKSHGRALLSDDDPLSRQNFINRMLTNNCYYMLNYDKLFNFDDILYWNFASLIY